MLNRLDNRTADVVLPSLDGLPVRELFETLADWNAVLDRSQNVNGPPPSVSPQRLCSALEFEAVAAEADPLVHS